MLWKEVKSWCKTNGFYADRKKNKDEEENSYIYTWYKQDDKSIGGTTTSVSKLATIIYNVITNNLHLEYQQDYLAKKTMSDIDHLKEGWR